MPNDKNEAMTSDQEAELAALARVAREPEAFVQNLSRTAARQRIEILRAKLRKDVSGAQHKP
jgi:hypothetical protein